MAKRIGAAVGDAWRNHKGKVLVGVVATGLAVGGYLGIKAGIDYVKTSGRDSDRIEQFSMPGKFSYEGHILPNDELFSNGALTATAKIGDKTYEVENKPAGMEIAVGNTLITDTNGDAVADIVLHNGEYLQGAALKSFIAKNTNTIPIVLEDILADRVDQIKSDFATPDVETDMRYVRGGIRSDYLNHTFTVPEVLNALEEGSVQIENYKVSGGFDHTRGHGYMTFSNGPGHQVSVEVDPDPVTGGFKASRFAAELDTGRYEVVDGNSFEDVLIGREETSKKLLLQVVDAVADRFYQNAPDHTPNK